MERRKVLKQSTLIIPALLSGCTTTAISQSGENPQDRTINDGNDEQSTPVIAVENIDQTPSSVEGEFEVFTKQKVGTEETPPKVEISFTNNSKNENRYSFGSHPPFSTIYSIGDSPKLLLLPTTTSYKPVSARCWIPDLSPQEEILSTDKIKYVTLQSGESVRRQAHVWTSHQNNSDQCLPAGDYRFENKYNLSDSKFTWGFTISVK